MSNSKHKKPVPAKMWLVWASIEAHYGKPCRFRTAEGGLRFMESGDVSDMVPLYLQKDGMTWVNPEWRTAPYQFLNVGKDGAEIPGGLPAPTTPEGMALHSLMKCEKDNAWRGKVTTDQNWHEP